MYARQRDSKHKCSSVPKRRTLEEMKTQLSCCLETEWPLVEDDTEEMGRNWMSQGPFSRQLLSDMITNNGAGVIQSHKQSEDGWIALWVRHGFSQTPLDGTMFTNEVVSLANLLTYPGCIGCVGKPRLTSGQSHQPLCSVHLVIPLERCFFMCKHSKLSRTQLLTPPTKRQILPGRKMAAAVACHRLQGQAGLRSNSKLFHL